MACFDAILPGIASPSCLTEVSFAKLTSMPVLEKIGRMKYIPEQEYDAKHQEIMHELEEQYQTILKGDDVYA
jgi:hypothetical protein